MMPGVSEVWEEVGGFNAVVAPWRFEPSTMVTENHLTDSAWMMLPSSSQREMESLTRALQRELCDFRNFDNSNELSFAASYWKCKAENNLCSEAERSNSRLNLSRINVTEMDSGGSSSGMFKAQEEGKNLTISNASGQNLSKNSKIDEAERGNNLLRGVRASEAEFLAGKGTNLSSQSLNGASDAESFVFKGKNLSFLSVNGASELDSSVFKERHFNGAAEADSSVLKGRNLSSLSVNGAVEAESLVSKGRNLSSLSESLALKGRNTSSLSIDRAAEAESLVIKGRNTSSLSVNGAGKVNKRRSRAASKTPITFLKADPANFRAMVQQVTGVPLKPSAARFWPPCSAAGGGGDAPAVLKPEPKRASTSSSSAASMIQGLPTLDTSALFIHSARQNPSFASPPPPSNKIVLTEKLRAACMQTFTINNGGNGGEDEFLATETDSWLNSNNLDGIFIGSGAELAGGSLPV